MATIALYAGKMNRMSGLFEEVKKSVTDYQSELTALKQKALKINRDVCNLEEVICSVQASSQTQEQKINSLDGFQHNSEQFAVDTVRIDSEAAREIRQRKEAFYNKYNYLRPDAEKNGWEKFCEGCRKARDWCKEHWVMAVTVFAVIGIAVLAVATFGLAVAAVAAIAGIISLVLCAADMICILATGGKDLSTVFRENGWNVLADIFQGLQIGCDIVAILLPAGAAIKAMAKIGIKSFAKASFHAVKIAFRETVEALGKNGFQRSFKDGIKNLGKIAFKTFIVDTDDFKQVRNGKQVWSLMENTLDMTAPNKNWIIDKDRLIPSSAEVAGKYNPDRLTMAEIMGQEKFSNFPEVIPYKNGYPDLSGFSVADVDISMKNFDVDKILKEDINTKKFSKELRNMNMKNADKGLLENLGKTKIDFENTLGYELTWHEDLNMKKCFLVPTEIHSNLGHTGGVSNYKFQFSKIPSIDRLVGNKLTQFGFRFSSKGIVDTMTEN